MEGLYGQQAGAHEQAHGEKQCKNGGDAAPDHDLGGQHFVAAHLPGHDGAGYRRRGAEEGDQGGVVRGDAVQKAQSCQQDGGAQAQHRGDGHPPEGAPEDFPLHIAYGGKIELAAENDQGKGGGDGARLAQGSIEKL